MVDASAVDIGIRREGKTEGNIIKVNEHKHRVDELQMQVDKVIFFFSRTQTNFLSVKNYTHNLSRIICNLNAGVCLRYFSFSKIKHIIF